MRPVQGWGGAVGSDGPRVRGERRGRGMGPSEAIIMLSIWFCLFEGYQTRGRRYWPTRLRYRHTRDPPEIFSSTMSTLLRRRRRGSRISEMNPQQKRFWRAWCVSSVLRTLMIFTSDSDTPSHHSDIQQIDQTTSPLFNTTLFLLNLQIWTIHPRCYQNLVICCDRVLQCTSVPAKITRCLDVKPSPQQYPDSRCNFLFVWMFYECLNDLKTDWRNIYILL